MEYFVLAFIVYGVGYLVGYFTGHTIALSKVQVVLAKSREREVSRLYPDR